MQDEIDFLLSQISKGSATAATLTTASTFSFFSSLLNTEPVEHSPCLSRSFSFAEQIKLKLLFSSSQVSSSTPAPPAAASIPTTAAPLSLLLSPFSSGSHIFSAPQPSSPPVNASSVIVILLRGSSCFPDEILERVIGMLKSRKDRSSVSLVCKEWYNAERWSRRNVFIELRLKRMTVTDESLKFLVRSFPNSKAISLQNCDGFSTDGLAAIAADCKLIDWRRDVAFAGYEVAIQMDISAEKMIFGVAGIDPERRAELIKVLGVERTASQQEIKKAYYKLALRLHPDKNPGDEEAKANFQQLQNVISILGDEEKRVIYDQIGCVDDADLAGDVVQNLHNYFRTMYKKVVCVDPDFVLISCRTVLICIYKSVDPKEKQNAFEIGQSYIDKAVSLEGLSPRVPLYKVTEGNEPCFFTTYFPWDHAKASVQGNSFQKKVTLFFGIHHAVEEKSNGPSQGGPRQRAEAFSALSNAFNSSSDMTSSMSQDRLNGLNQGGPRQRAEALAALNSAFKSSSGTKSSSPKTTGRSQGSQRATSVAALSQVLTAEKKKQSPDSSPVPTRSPVVETSTSSEKHSSYCLS
ncbi:uncharacterized protein DS421_20g687220 [Arachis hypogaea]|nr:uncharacterized protein DS421_20g687220 [Arachis hypogaea]